MIIKIENDSHVSSFSGLALKQLSRYLHAIDAAPNIDSLRSLYPDDVKVDGNTINIAIRDNFQSVVGNIQGKVTDSIIVIKILAYD